MDRQALVHRRKKRYMAQVLDEFDEKVAPLLPPEVAKEFKGTIRRKLHALALDAIEFLTLPKDQEINGHAIELRDQLANRSTRA